MVRLDSVPKRWANPKAIAKIEEAVGRVVTIPILAGEPVLEHQDRGQRGRSRAGGDHSQGDACLYHPDADDRHRRGRVYSARQQGRRALDGEGNAAAGPTCTAAPSSCSRISRSWPSTSGLAPIPPRRKSSVRTKELRSVTLLVTPEQAAKLDLGGNLGTLHLTLRNPEDAAEVSSSRLATIAELSRKPSRVPGRDTQARCSCRRLFPRPRRRSERIRRKRSERSGETRREW